MIRKTKKEDLSDVFDLLSEAWLDTYVDLGIDKKAILSMFKNKKDWIKNFEYFLDSNDSVSYVIFDSKKIAGIIFGKIGKIQALYINSKLKRKGFGKKLLDMFIQHGSPVYLSVLKINTEAQEFYLKNNFKPTGKYTYFSINNKKYRDLEFTRV